MFRETPCPVAILTTSTTEGLQYHDYGMTLASVTSLSLSPKPMVTFNVKIPSRTFAAIRSRQTPRILIHMLADTKAGAALAIAFSQGQGSKAFEHEDLRVCRWGHGLPLLEWVSKSWSEGGGVRSALDCSVTDAQLYVQDHVIVVAEIENILVPTFRGPSMVRPKRLRQARSKGRYPLFLGRFIVLQRARRDARMALLGFLD